MANSTEPSTTPAMTGLGSTTTMANSTEPSTTPAMTGLGGASSIISSSSTVGTTIPYTTSPITTTTTNAITTKPNLMNNGFKIPQTNLLQSNFNGSSNIYSPYLYVREPFQPNSYDMNNYQHI
jgi:hypothetical protein